MCGRPLHFYAWSPLQRSLYMEAMGIQISVGWPFHNDSPCGHPLQIPMQRKHKTTVKPSLKKPPLVEGRT